VIKPLGGTQTVLAHRDLREVRFVARAIIEATGQKLLLSEGWT
jgi:hypothetical protein